MSSKETSLPILARRARIDVWLKVPRFSVSKESNICPAIKVFQVSGRRICTCNYVSEVVAVYESDRRLVKLLSV